MARLRVQSIAGSIIIAEYYNVGNTQFLEDEDGIKRELRSALEKAGTTVYDICSRKFGPGVTAVAIIGDSHAAFHTWPENAYARLTMDAYPHTNPDYATKYFQELLQSEKPRIRRVKLGINGYNI